MDNRLDILIQTFLENKIDVKSFTDDFTLIYSQETDFERLDPKKYKLFRELNTVTSRYSPYQDEIERYKAHYSENDVRLKAKEVWNLIRQ